MNAREVRRFILETALRDGKGHIPPALSWVEIALALFQTMKPEDRFVLSKTHGHLTLDAIVENPATLMWPGWPFKCSGSLGQGLGIGAGMALAAKLDGTSGRTFVVLGDAELHEGAIWEAAAFAAHHSLPLVTIVDDNRQCCADFTRDVLDMEPIGKKFQAFGWTVAHCDGHDLPLLASHLRDAKGPFCLIARTVKGKGIPFMEGNPEWHHRMPKGAEIEEARKALA